MLWSRCHGGEAVRHIQFPVDQIYIGIWLFLLENGVEKEQDNLMEKNPFYTAIDEAFLF